MISKKVVRALKKSVRMTLAFLIAVVLLVIAMVTEITLVFTVNSQQADETGSTKLELVSRELEQTINDAARLCVLLLRHRMISATVQSWKNL